MKDPLDLFPHLIGLVAGELQYTGIDEKNIRNSLIDDNEEVKKELIPEIETLQENIHIYWKQFSNITNIYFESEEELSNWLKLLINICRENN